MSVQICSDATWPMIGSRKKVRHARGVTSHICGVPHMGGGCFTPMCSVSMTDATKQDSCFII